MTALIAIIVFLYGMIFLSFFDVLATRIPKGETLLGRSHCEHCDKQLKLVDVIPVLGFIINRGKCSTCHSPIPYYHPLIEIFGGLLFSIAYLFDGFTLPFWIAAIMISVLMIETIADIRYRIVIDRIWMLGLVPLMIIRIIQGSWVIHLISSVSIFVFLYLLAFIYQKATKKEALGGGDIKLYIFIGWLLTPVLSFLSLFLGSIFGLIYSVIKKKGQTYIPLVPFLAIGVYLAYYYGEWLINGYLSWIRM